MSEPRFHLGKVVATSGALEAMNSAGQRPDVFLRRHAAGDWADLSEVDRQENELSVENGLRILSAYETANGTRIWVITEADRSSTCVLLPEEY